MKKWIILGVVLILLISVYSSIKGTFNGMVAGDESVKNAWAQVENVFQRRFDLIPNLIATVKGYAAHEEEVLTAVTNARARVGGAGAPSESIEANNMLSGALSRLLVVVENYPNLKADQGFIRLQDELAGTENRIAVERRRYNNIVLSYNTMIRSFPNRLYAGLFGFDSATPFEATAGADIVPKVEF